MKLMLWLLALSGYCLTVHCSLTTIVANPGGIGGIFKGPDSETIVHGPDGSVITSEQRGGIVQTEAKLEPIIVAEPEVLEVGSPIPQGIIQSDSAGPLLVPESGPGLGAISATIAAPLEPVLTGTVEPGIATIPIGKPVEIVEQDPHIIETDIVDAPAVELKGSTDLVGPSGSISTRGSESIVSGPASTTITKAAKILIAAPKINGIPVTASVSTPIHAPPLVEINNELSLSSPGPLSSVGNVISSTLSPLHLGGVGISSVAPPLLLGSSVAPPLSIGSTIAPPTLQQTIPLLPSNGPRVIPLDGVGIGSPIFRQNLPLAPPSDQRVSTIDDSEHIRQGLAPIGPLVFQPAPHGPTEGPVLLTGEQYDDVRPNPVPTYIRQQIPNNGLGLAPPVSSTLGPSHGLGQGLTPIGPLVYQPAPGGPTEGSVLLTGEQYDDVRPNPVPTYIRQQIPNNGLGLAPPVSSTLGPSYGAAPSTGVNVVDEGASGFVQPGEVQSSTGAPLSSTLSPPPYNLLPPRGNVQNVPQEWLLNRQLVIDPSQIPQYNIVPPEIGLPKGTVDLGSTVQTQTTSVPNLELNGLPRASGLLSSPNIQRIDKANLQRIDQRVQNNIEQAEVERTLQNGYYQNEIIVGNRANEVYPQNNPNPIQRGVGIAPGGILGAELGRAGIDSSQIQLTNVPLSDVTGLNTAPETRGQQDYDDRVEASLWNRYGRRRRNRKY